jgi:hypothetical protein
MIGWIAIIVRVIGAGDVQVGRVTISPQLPNRGRLGGLSMKLG